MDRIDVVAVEPDPELWDRFFTPAPIFLVGTVDADGRPDVAPKHLAMPLGWRDKWCFVCTPRHATYRNAVATGAFTVSYPSADQIVLIGLAAAGRAEDGSKPSLAALATRPAQYVPGVLVEGARAWLECELDRTVDGIDDASLVVGRVVAAAVAERSLRSPDRDDAELLREAPVLVYLPPHRFATVGESHVLPYPPDLAR
jgi:flavin reductase (DIM6/NTAB) family NADH-FMN oxidoreductase RutF